MLNLVRDIVQRKNALLAVKALPPECKNGIAKVQGKLSGIRVKSRLLSPDGNEPLKVMQYPCMSATGVVQAVL